MWQLRTVPVTDAEQSWTLPWLWDAQHTSYGFLSGFDGIETRCAITELDSTNTCPGPMVFFWQINRALQGCAFSSQGEST